MPAATFFKPIEEILNGNCQYQYYSPSEDSFSMEDKTRICHVCFEDTGELNNDIVLTIFTIRNQNDKWKIHSEGAQRTDPGSTVPLRNAAIKLAEKNKWKYFSVAVAGENAPIHDVISNYVVSIESYSYGDNTAYDLSDALKKLLELGKPEFYRTETEEINGKRYSLAFIRKDHFIEYLKQFDNRPYDMSTVCREQEIIQDDISFKDYNEEDLGKILRTMYNSAPQGEMVASIHLFGIKFGKIIKENGLSTSKINSVAGINKSYSTELTKGVKAFECIEANKYGVHFKDNPLGKYSEPQYNTCIEPDFARNKIYFGAPGTGKSFELNKEKDKLIAKGGECERVTFHPDYSFANFVGTYKPVSDSNNNIRYAFVPGPFIRVYIKAIKSGKSENPLPFVLLIEEINRANVAAVFGDAFQLLDRDEKNVSEYPIQIAEDLRGYLASQLGGCPEDYQEIKIPDNMFIWATMNSADQGVFPMDTAFKRRWDFKYLGINNSEDEIKDAEIVLGQGVHEKKVNWNTLRKAINDVLLTECKVNEDKLMGPFFVAKKDLPKGTEESEKRFKEVFKDKVIMYLFEDAAKQKRPVLFSGCTKKNSYSSICEEFETKGVDIFNDSVRSEFTQMNGEE